MMHFHPFIFDVELIQSVIAGEVKHVMISCGFETFQMFYFFLLSCRETCCTQIQGAMMISQ